MAEAQAARMPRLDSGRFDHARLAAARERRLRLAQERRAGSSGDSPASLRYATSLTKLPWKFLVGPLAGQVLPMIPELKSSTLAIICRQLAVMSAVPL